MKSLARLSLCLLLTGGAGSTLAAPPDNASDVIKHLEFLGYEVSLDSERILAKHSKFLNVLLRKYRGGILFSAFVGASDYGRDHQVEWLPLINELNVDAAAVRYYLDGDGDLAVEGYYPGGYDKRTFSTFLDAFNLSREQLSDKLDRLNPYIK